MYHPLHHPLHPVNYVKFVLTKFGLCGQRYSRHIGLSLLFVLLLIGLVYVWTPRSGLAALECYKYPQLDEDIISVNDYQVLPNSIFFLETSCRHGGGIDITKRQACAYESAAKVHPDSEVLILFPSPISLKNPSVLVSELLKYPNIKFLHIDVEKYFLHTPLEEWYKENRIKSSLWPIWHMSDVLRYLTLWKYGGTYLDSDMVMIRPVNTMQNFAGAETEKFVAEGVLNFNISNSGREIIDDVLFELRYSFCGCEWNANGVDAISRVLRRTCKEDDIQKMTQEKCKGFSVFPPSAFYPIPWYDWRVYFEESESLPDPDPFSQSFGIHVWNKLSKDTPLRLNTRAPYSAFASEFCPKIYSAAGRYF